MGIFTDITRYLRVYRKYIGRRLYIVFVLTALAALAEGFGIALLLPLLEAVDAGDGAVEGGLQKLLYDLLHWIGIGDSVVGILAFIAVAFIGKGVLKFSEAGYLGYLEARLMRALKRRMFDGCSAMDYGYYIQRNTGHFINVITSQIQGFDRSFQFFTKFLASIIMVVAYFGIAFVVAWRFALMAVAVGLVMLFLFKYLNRYVRALSRRAATEYSILNKLLVQSLQAFEYIVATHQAPYLRSGVIDSIDRYTGYRLRQKVAKAFTSALNEPISILFIIIVIIIQVTVFNDPIAPIFVALILFHRGMKAVMTVQKHWQETMDEIGSLELVDHEFGELERRREHTGTHALGPLRHGIELRHVCYAYDEQEGDVMHDLSGFIPANTTVAFVGESGSGKSTVVRLLSLLLRPRQGDILIDGVSGSEVELASWRSQIGYVSQDTMIFDDTIANNICLWKGDYIADVSVQERVEEAAHRAYAHHFIEELPNGYQTVVGERGVRLSGGQRQRLFIARELYKNPNLLILDEATSALDTESERCIQESIDALKGSMTVVIIAHRLSTIKNVDYVYVLDSGRVVEEGSYEDLRYTTSRFREMVEMQSL